MEDEALGTVVMTAVLWGAAVYTVSVFFLNVANVHGMVFAKRRTAK